ncbi:MAG: outer membrane beta-barrel protein [Flavobacteriales bacterium]
MKHALLAFAVACWVPAVAQDSTTVPVMHTFQRVLVGFNISPDYCYRTLSSSNTGQGNSTIIDQWNADEQPKFGYSVGVNVQYNFSPHWGLALGAQYADRGYASDRTFDYVFNDPNDPAIPKHTNYRYDHTFVDFPVRLIFQAGRQRLRFIASLGLAGNVFLKASELRETEYEDGHKVLLRDDGSYAGYRQVNLSAIGSLGANYQLAERSYLQLEPTFRYNLFSIVDSPVNTYLWSGGLNLTFNYAIR